MNLLSVIVCTRNRSTVLPALLDSLRACAAPEGWQVEHVIVDNGSQDATREVIDAAARQAPDRVRHVAEPAAGLARARNAGVAACRGSLVAFTDDDCVADAQWLVRLVAAFAQDTQIGAVFGQVRALDAQQAQQAVAVKTDARPRRYQFPSSPLSIGHGNNMAFRRAVLNAVGPFDVALGAGGVFGAGEDVDMAYRVLRAGYVILYDPSCLIRHRSRATAAEVRRTHWRNAIGIGACFGHHWLRGDGFAGKCLWWFLKDLPATAGRVQARGETHERAVPWVYLCGVPAGVVRRLGYDVVRGTQGGMGATTRPSEPEREREGPGGADDAVGEAAGRQVQGRVSPAPTVTVVIPTYNRADYLPEALESVLAQTFTDWEIIIVDDGSTDDTRAVVQPYVARDPQRVRYVYQTNGGLSAARNTGCRLAQGRYVALLDSDDLWKPQKLAIQVPQLERQPAAGLISSRAEVVDAANTRVLSLKPQDSAGTTLPELITRGTQPPSSFLVRRSAGEAIGWFDAAIRRGIEDLDFCLRLARQWQLICLKEPLIRYRLHATNLSSEPLGTYEGYVRTYEKLLATPDPRVPRRQARRLYAKYLYLLGLAQQRRGERAQGRRCILQAFGMVPYVGWYLDAWKPWPVRAVNCVKAFGVALRAWGAP